MRLKWGLRARLAMALGAVAVLAVAANTMADRTVRVVIERVHSMPASRASASTPPPAPKAVPPVVDIPLRIEAADPKPVLVRRDELDAAIGGFARAVTTRIASSDPAFGSQVDEAGRVLDRRLREVQEDLASHPRAARRSLAQDVAELRSEGTASVALADRRRDALAEYEAALDNLADGARERLDDAWRIFGRVIAQQRLVELRNRVEELRQAARGLQQPGSMDEPAVHRLEALEAALAALLPPPRKGAASQDWDTRFRYRIESSIASRRQLLASDRALADGEARRAALVQSLGRRVAALPERVVPPAAPVSAPTPARPVAASPALPPASGSEPVAAAASAASAATEEAPTAVVTHEEEDDREARRSRRTLTIITVVALLATIAITVLTLRSLSRQFARLTDGIRRVARGEAASVEPGGIAELDAVANEFNAMSRQLAQARAENLGYQHELETRVAQRTAQLGFQAAHDPLTELPNRRELARLLQGALVSAAQAGRRVGVFLIDLDNFKVINDGLGHSYGDQVLYAIAQRLRALTPPGGFAARLGGDEFTVVAAGASDVETIRDTGWALVRAFQQPLEVDGRELLLSVSVGASVYPDHEATADSLMRAADSALFRAKALGRSQLTLFSPEMFDAAKARFTTEQSLRRALERGEFELVFQPEVDAATFEVQSVEALLRWRLPEGRQACPAEFLSVAEESGLIGPISDWVLGEAIAAAGRWHRAGWTSVRVAINVSSRQFVDLGFVGRVQRLLEAEGLPPTAVEIELTENVLQTGAHTLRTLEGLREAGIATALDDFGTGYSSLSSIEQLPLSRVKLDRSLIDSIDTNPRSAAIAQSIIGLCQGLGLALTAEGIERLEQFDRLMRHPSLTLQGYLIARPAAEAEIDALRVLLPQRLASLLLSLPEDGAPRAIGTDAVDESRRTGYL